MGIDFTAVVGHRFTAGDLARCPESLAAIEPSLRELETYCEMPPESWRCCFPREGSEIGTRFRERLHAYMRRGGMGLAIGQRSMKVHHICRWRHFAAGPDVAHLLRRVCHDLAQWAGTTCAMYLPDTFVVEAFEVVFDGLSLEETLRVLEEKAGPPAASIPETVVASPDGSPWRYGYFIDRFEGEDALPGKHGAARG